MVRGVSTAPRKKASHGTGRFPFSGENVIKGMREAMKGAGKMAKEAGKVRETSSNDPNVPVEQLKRELRQQRLEKMVKLLKPEEREKISEFVSKLGQNIDQLRKRGVPPQYLKKHANYYTERFLEDIYPNSKYNEQRQKIIVRAILAE